MSSAAGVSLCCTIPNAVKDLPWPRSRILAQFCERDWSLRKRTGVHKAYSSKRLVALPSIATYSTTPFAQAANVPQVSPKSGAAFVTGWEALDTGEANVFVFPCGASAAPRGWLAFPGRVWRQARVRPRRIPGAPEC